MIRVSSGTAAVLGMKPSKVEVAPTTAYLMCGEKCSRSCGFCSQARDSAGRAGLLSRVTWPEFSEDGTVDKIADAYSTGSIKRACIQVVMQAGFLDKTIGLIKSIKQESCVPVCVSVNTSLDNLRSIFLAGADRVSIPLDAASEPVFTATKGEGFDRTLNLIEQASMEFPGRIGTHLIAGLGETDQDILERIQWMHDRGVSCALFSFTPVRGTRLGEQSPPPIERYRAIQAARYLIVNGYMSVAIMQFTNGSLCGFNATRDTLDSILRSGEAFMTSGCLDCNRPYYNERPGNVMYNYPRPLTEGEALKAVDEALSWVVPWEEA